LFASELFGHRKGAFTGAAFDRKGRMLLADGGDLFLDEIGNMPPDVQVGLLRVLDGGQVVAVGAERGQEVDVRVLSATNVDIEQSAVNGRFRSDLLDRLRVGGIIRLPPLRQRRADIPLLAEKFLEDALRTLPYARIREITPEAMAMLTADEWPGNVRELESCVFGAVREHSDVEFLYPAHFKRSSAAYVAVAPAVHEVQARSTATLSSLMEEFEGLAADRLPATELAGAAVRAQRVQARLLARLLLGALRATARITPNEPQGRAMIHPAVKLLLGDAGITASEAADVVKRFLSVAPEAIEDLMRERLLSEALASALRLRPRSGGARSNRGRPEGV
jgi:transcriptional regulator with GAF, ATPase, and Fis domain